MTVATLRGVLQPALEEGYAVAGLVCLGWEDARAYAMAADEAGVPVILQAGPGARAHMPIPVWAKMLRRLAEEANVPIVVHLDHGRSEEEARTAIGEGFTSVMYDGSLDPLEKNIADTARIAELARKAGVSCEGEVGQVGYADGAASHATDPADAARFVSETGVDALAISVGNVHLQTDAEDGLDRAAVDRIASATDVPLVIHGGSGVPAPERRQLAHETPICKFNIGTELRQVFGARLRARLAEDTREFDRIKILAGLEPDLRAATLPILKNLAR